MIKWMVQSASSLTNLALSGYIVFVHEIIYDYFFHDLVFKSSRETLVQHKTNYLLAVILVIVSILEFIAFRWKAQGRKPKERNPRIKKKYKKEIKDQDGNENDLSTGSMLIWIFHLVLSIVILLSAMTALNIPIKNYPLIGFFLITFILIKEFFILGILLSKPNTKNLPRWKSILSDIFLTFFYTIIYTVVISNILYIDDYNNFLLAFSYSWIYMGINIIIILILFYFFYLPLRLPYFLQKDNELSNEKFDPIVSLRYISLILVGVSAILPLFEGYTSVENALNHRDKARVLFLNRHNLKELPKEVVQLSQLEALHLGQNQIESLPEDIKKLENLKWLNIGSNHLKEFPQVLEKLSHLEVLYIHMNKIKKFPEDLTFLKKLKKITYYSNPMKYEEKIRLSKKLPPKNSR